MKLKAIEYMNSKDFFDTMEKIEGHNKEVAAMFNHLLITINFLEDRIERLEMIQENENVRM